jgi:hypothetical protein
MIGDQGGNLMRRLLVLDVDGPLRPWAANAATRPAAYVEHRIRLGGWSRRKTPPLWLNPAHGPALLHLAKQIDAQLVWATTWEHEANTTIGPAIGLPTLPVIELAAHLEPRPGQPFTWKYGPVARYANGRPLAWLDDDFDAYPAARDTFLADRATRDHPTELVRVDPRTGITDEHLTTILTWAQSLDGGHS